MNPASPQAVIETNVCRRPQEEKVDLTDGLPMQTVRREYAEYMSPVFTGPMPASREHRFVHKKSRVKQDESG